MVSAMTHGAAHVTKTFPGPNGLTGIIVQGSQGPLVAWVTDQKSAIIVGNVVNSNNRNLTTSAAKTYLEKSGFSPAASSQPPLPDTSPHAEAVNDPYASGSASSTSGEAALQSFVNDPHAAVTISDPNTNGPHALYVFFDPNCIACHDLFDLVQKNVAAFNKAGVRVVYIPVAILKQSSAGKAAEVVANGWSALLRDETRFNENTEEGGLSGKGVSPQSLAAAHMDTGILSRLSAENNIGVATPLLVWRANNRHVYYLSGAPGSSGDLDKLLRSFSSGWKPVNK
jgi:thiol:disulfide interchange protein DsbG